MAEANQTGKSLHGWFDAPRNKVFENRLNAGLEVFGCDPKVLMYSQPVRVPGAWRDGRLYACWGSESEDHEWTLIHTNAERTHAKAAKAYCGVALVSAS